MHIELDLNQNDAEALLRHCQTHKPASGDAREDRRLEDALQALAEALISANSPQ
ncbi:hypothetical protein K4A76_14575 [Pseudomonas sp. NEEL19]|uniref:hypothetical protein n=1 Tax=Pseudomonas sp. NEEL19 TaxID=2867409 RepID=UPI002368E387|nr:hypothetical protein [Pseudomonas sp. NEEL19]WDM57699.1 hypothetical protein K4A76_14575 [Pseudomonas sp. NEEL19]